MGHNFSTQLVLLRSLGQNIIWSYDIHPKRSPHGTPERNPCGTSWNIRNLRHSCDTPSVAEELVPANPPSRTPSSCTLQRSIGPSSGASPEPGHAEVSCFRRQKMGNDETSPIGSMYGIYANIGGILMVNVTIYSIHGSYGSWNIYCLCLS